MINLLFVLGCLVIACAAISVVYALTSPGEPPKIVSESVTSFGLMFGGIIALAVAIMIIPKIFGR